MLCCPEIGIVNKNVGQKFRQMFFRGVIHLLQIDMYLSKKQLFFRKKKGNEVIMGSVKNKISFAKMSQTCCRAITAQKEWMFTNKKR